MQQYHTPFNAVGHFAINADDIERARGFYETVFGWRFEAWGAPNFYQIETGAPPRGALPEGNVVGVMQYAVAWTKAGGYADRIVRSTPR